MARLEAQFGAKGFVRGRISRINDNHNYATAQGTPQDKNHRGHGGRPRQAGMVAEKGNLQPVCDSRVGDHRGKGWRRGVAPSPETALPS